MNVFIHLMNFSFDLINVFIGLMNVFIALIQKLNFFIDLISASNRLRHPLRRSESRRRILPTSAFLLREQRHRKCQFDGG
jgi:hypothetical protein